MCYTIINCYMCWVFYCYLSCHPSVLGSKQTQASPSWCLFIRVALPIALSCLYNIARASPSAPGMIKDPISVAIPTRTTTGDRSLGLVNVATVLSLLWICLIAIIIRALSPLMI